MSSSNKNGYNKGKDNPMYGRRHSPEAMQKMYGRRHSIQTIKKISDALTGENNPMWVGDTVKYDALHAYIRRHLPKSIQCQMCEKVPPFDLANISGLYKRDLDDWTWLCRRCHMLSDGRMLELVKRNMTREGRQKKAKVLVQISDIRKIFSVGLGGR